MKQGKFSVMTVNTEDKTVAMLTDLPAGERDDGGNIYPDASINGRVEATLQAFAKTLQEFE